MIERVLCSTSKENTNENRVSIDKYRPDGVLPWRGRMTCLFERPPESMAEEVLQYGLWAELIAKKHMCGSFSP